jgi:type IV pilus assembly protein PilY1
VTFGTGSFSREGDDSTASAARVQTLYGLFDTAVVSPTAAVRTDLQVQTVTSNTSPVTLGTTPNETTYPAGDLRFVSQNPISTSQRGWRIDLPVSGERVTSEATFPSGAIRNRVRFTTLVPDSDPCGAGRRGFVMDISLATGARFDTAIFDLSGDRLFNSGDMVGGANVSGVGGSTGERLTVIRSSDANLDNLYGGDGKKLTSSLNTSGVSGRQSWRQLR